MAIINRIGSNRENPTFEQLAVGAIFQSTGDAGIYIKINDHSFNNAFEIQDKELCSLDEDDKVQEIEYDIILKDWV